MELFVISLLLAAILCSLVAGFLFAFEVVVMPGIKRLNDREFISAFQVMDRVIQDNNPVFVLAWLGSIVFLIISVLTGIGELQGIELFILVSAALIYLLGVQLPTFIVNVPLNNKLQAIDVGRMNEAELSPARNDFEPRWNKWNRLRTLLSFLSSLLLIILLLKL